MKKLSSMVDMRRSQEEKSELAMSSYPSPGAISDYPYGLCISLTNEELEKLELDHSDCAPGDMLHLHALAMVTSVSTNANKDQEPQCRIELQITHINAENEDEENEEDDEEPKMSSTEKMKKLYK